MTAYEMPISDWSSHVFSSDLRSTPGASRHGPATPQHGPSLRHTAAPRHHSFPGAEPQRRPSTPRPAHRLDKTLQHRRTARHGGPARSHPKPGRARHTTPHPSGPLHTFCTPTRSEEHTSELQSLMRISYAVFCLKTKNKTT